MKAFCTAAPTLGGSDDSANTLPQLRHTKATGSLRHVKGHLHSGYPES